MLKSKTRALDAFFGADERRPKKTIEDGIGVADSYFVYAQGQIVLYSAKFPVKTSPIEVLKAKQYNHLAVATRKPRLTVNVPWRF